MVCMGKIFVSDAFDILVKDDKEEILKTFGEHGFGKIRDCFIDSVESKIDVDDESVKKSYNNIITNYE